MSEDEDDGAAPKLRTTAEFSLFVRNLSPQVSEQVLREVFAGCDLIERVAFRAYPNSANSFFAQIDFATLQGVTEGSKLSGVPILGVPCEIGVVDPVVSAAQLRLAHAAGDKLPEPGAAKDLEDLNRRVGEAREDQRLRTVHVAGLTPGTDSAKLHRFCKNFGDVEKLRVDTDARGVLFGLVEFKDHGAAHICKLQRQYVVDGKVFTCTEAKVLVDESEFMEQTIEFQAPVRDAMGMKHILSQQLDLREKLDKVRAAALAFVSKDASPSSPAIEGVVAPEDAATAEEANERKTKKKQDKAEKKAQKKLKKKLKKERKEEKKKRKARSDGGKVRKREAKPTSADGDVEGDEESLVASVSESPDGPVDLDSEVEVVENTELCVLGTSASSVSSTSSDEKPPPPRARRKRKAPTVLPKNSMAIPLTIEALQGRWMVGDDAGVIWTILEGGRAMFNGRRVRPKWSFVQEPCGEAEPLTIFCDGQRAAGWELDMRRSTLERLVWTKAEIAEVTLWHRQAEPVAAPPLPPALPR
mmetsp:Transcript_47161/g.132626  ORF Transcript_47161/g.132626 Transcript_47161/m.132626 type:complete len:528 (-) Transcript_47161:103-1686(-)